MNERRFLHEAPVPADMDGVKARLLLQRAGRCDATVAVLGMLRELSAESAQTARQCARTRKAVAHGANGQVVVTEMDNPEFHEGAAAALEDAFWAVLAAIEEREGEE